jgi:UDP-N-acetylglucosamine 4,6-dehydratase
MSYTGLFKDKSVLITGGTGSFGRAFARRLLLEDECRKVIIFSRDEWKQWEMRESDPIFNHRKIRYFLGDVRDPGRLPRAFNEVNIIIHAAALKQVPAAEYNPTEFIKTNVNGAMNVIDAAINSEVELVLALSTDKAVNPINLYGATKLCSDKLFVAGNAYVGARGMPKFSVVRYGNVSGSRGSVLPLWGSMLARGATSLPVTDPRMTRFWITLDQAVDFVIHCLAKMKGGEIFVPKIPSIHILDLLEAVAPGMPHTVTGIRDGEKLHELMVGVEDARHTLEYERHYVIIPEMYTRDDVMLSKFMHGDAKFAPESFSYASNLNSHWLNLTELKELAANFLHSH